MQQKINIRNALDNAFDEIHALLVEFALFQKTPEKITITAPEMNEAKHSLPFYIAEDSNKNIAGFGCFFIDYFSWTGTT